MTEADVRAAAKAGRAFVVPDGAVVTPAARDLARQLGVALVEEGAGLQAHRRTDAPDTEAGTGDRGTEKTATPEKSRPSTANTVALGADHGGYPLKETLKPLLGDLGYEVLDLGTHSTEPVDYPDYAVAVARAVAEGKAWRGIMVDGAGIGSAMAANKVKGVRAALCYDLTTAANAREHNDANVLTLGGTLIGTRLAAEIVRAFLGTAFAGGRHAPRVEKINRLDGARG